MARGEALLEPGRGEGKEGGEKNGEHRRHGGLPAEVRGRCGRQERTVQPRHGDDGRRTLATPVVVEVRDPIDPPPVVLVSARLDDSHGGSRLDSLVVGQQVDYTVDVLLNEPARGRLRRNPTFYPPEMASVLAYDVDIPRGPPHGRRCFETLSYRRALFPLFPGRVAIPPAVLTYSLPRSRQVG